MSREDLPPDQQPGRRAPVDLAVPSVRNFPASYYWPEQWSYRWVVLPCVVVFAAAGLFVAASVASRPTSGFELAGSAVAWVWVDRAGQVIACLSTAALLVATWRPERRRTIALTMWGIFSLQVGSFLLSGAEYPGNSCWAQPGWVAITLSYQAPQPVVTAPLGAHVVVTVPGYWSGAAGDVYATAGIVRKDCTVSLPGGGRRAIFAALKPGTATVGSDVAPNRFSTPSWRGSIVVEPTWNQP